MIEQSKGRRMEKIMTKTNDTSSELTGNELAETELAHVVGGTLSKTSAKGSDQQVYMTITMTDVFVASYH